MSIFRKHHPALEACPHCGKEVAQVRRVLNLLRDAKLEVAALQRHRLLGPGRATDGNTIRAHQATGAGTSRPDSGATAGREPGAQETPTGGAPQVRERGSVNIDDLFPLAICALVIAMMLAENIG